MELLDADSDAHAFKELSLWQRSFYADLVIGLGNLPDLLEVDVGCQIHVANIIQNCLLVLYELVILQTTERA